MLMQLLIIVLFVEEFLKQNYVQSMNKIQNDFETNIVLYKDFIQIITSLLKSNRNRYFKNCRIT